MACLGEVIWNKRYLQKVNGSRMSGETLGHVRRLTGQISTLLELAVFKRDI